jgi:hypothetical protein
MRRKAGIPHGQITHDRLWNKRPDGITFKMQTKTQAGVSDLPTGVQVHVRCHQTLYS